MPWSALSLGIVGACLLTFINFAADKRRAVTGRERIPERLLILCALAGGSAGALVGMLLFRHKIRKLLFWSAALIPTLVLLWFLPGGYGV